MIESEMTAIALQPAGDAASQKHYVDTIENPVPLDQIFPFISESDQQVLAVLYPSGVVPTWGVTPGKRGQNATKWDRLEVGDVTLFSRHGRIVASGVMTHKLHSVRLAESLWNRKDDGSTWEYVYFLDEITNHEFPVKEVNKVVGYKPNNVIQGFNVLDEEKSLAILDHFKLDSDIHFPSVTESEYFSALDKEDSLDESANTVRRKEQGFLRKMLFGSCVTGQCCICHRILPVQFLVTAHIKKRSECSLSEKRDYRNIVAPMCKLGCDDLYEKRYLYVENGLIKANSSVQATSDLDALISVLDGTKCLAWTDGNRDYFDWHRRQTLAMDVGAN